MSRIIVFGLDGISVGELHGNCMRGWAINEGGQATIALPADDARNRWLDIGRMLLIEHPKLPPWAGMVDTPWNALIPSQATVYNSEYLLSIRSLEIVTRLTGTAGRIVAKLIDLANRQEDLLIRPGNVDYYNDIERNEIFDQRPVWELIVALVKKAGMEIMLRPDRDANNRLVIYYDIQQQLGVDTGIELHDGAHANITITSVSVDGVIVNRVTGISDQGTATSRLQTDPQSDTTSIAAYRLRSQVVQYSGVTQMSTLIRNTRNYLTANKDPKVYLTVEVLDKGDVFYHLRLGNTLLLHAANILLPGGRRGWRGSVRITAMAYDESKNTVTMALEGSL